MARKAALSILYNIKRHIYASPWYRINSNLYTTVSSSFVLSVSLKWINRKIVSSIILHPNLVNILPDCTEDIKNIPIWLWTIGKRSIYPRQLTEHALSTEDLLRKNWKLTKSESPLWLENKVPWMPTELFGLIK